VETVIQQGSYSPEIKEARIGENQPFRESENEHYLFGVKFALG
jgi:hypothetical protein